MICFLTSLPCFEEKPVLNPANRFVEELRHCIMTPCRALYICSDPNDEGNDSWGNEDKTIFENSGFEFESFELLDGRNADRARELVKGADFIILAGGHVPTQNRFFASINLRGLLSGFDGVLLGISAGSMNSAETVYSQPEEPGEAKDPEYRRFLPGLGLTKTMLLPHYYYWKDAILDGMHAIRQIALPDSMGRTFYYIPDGSYLFIKDGIEELRGEAYMLKNGEMRQVSREGDTLLP